MHCTQGLPRIESLERKAQAEARKARREGGYRPRPQNPKPQMASTGGFTEDFEF
jgi:hypothetical protein